MLTDLLKEVVNARDDKEKERALRRLERIGMDRHTVAVLLKESIKDKEKSYDKRTVYRRDQGKE